MAPGAGPSNKILKVQSHSAPNGNLLHFHSKSSVTSFSSQNTFIPLNKSRVQFEFEQPGRWASRPFKDKVARLWILHDQVLDNTTQKWLMSNKKTKNEAMAWSAAKTNPNIINLKILLAWSADTQVLHINRTTQQEKSNEHCRFVGQLRSLCMLNLQKRIIQQRGGGYTHCNTEI